MSNSNYLGKQVNQAGQLTNVQAANGSIGTLKSGKITSGIIIESNQGFTSRRVVAFGQTGFATMGATAATLVAFPGAAATGVALVTLPEGAVISRIHADNNGTTVTNPGDLLIGLGNSNSNPSTTVMSVTVANTSINNAQGVYRPLSGSFTGTTSVEGEAPPQNVVVPTGPANYLVVQHTGSAQTAGDLRVVVDYYLLS